MTEGRETGVECRAALPAAGAYVPRMSEPARGPAHRITSFIRVSGVAALAVWARRRAEVHPPYQLDR
jgi:hypothetical protein